MSRSTQLFEAWYSGSDYRPVTCLALVGRTEIEDSPHGIPENSDPDSDSQISQRVDRPAHEQSDLRVRSFELGHSFVEPLSQAAVVMWLVLFPAEQLLNIVFKSS